MQGTKPSLSAQRGLKEKGKTKSEVLPAQSCPREYISIGYPSRRWDEVEEAVPTAQLQTGVLSTLLTHPRCWCTDTSTLTTHIYCPTAQTPTSRTDPSGETVKLAQQPRAPCPEHPCSRRCRAQHRGWFRHKTSPSHKERYQEAAA